LAFSGLVYFLFPVLLGIFSGLGVFTFGYAKGASYLSNNPKTCVNCHVMEDYYDSWQNSSHAHVAVCNDCHLSHHPVGKWVTKADNGFFHSLAFTLENYPEPIRIKARNREVTQHACVDCHQETIHEMITISVEEKQAPYCFQCHSDVGHAHNRPRNTVNPDNPRSP